MTALFHGFAPSFVARALPSVWEICSPADALRVREDLAATALARAGVTGEASAVTGPLVAALSFEGRALAAAHAATPRPADPLRALWWDCTVLRELRGDGHVAALVTAGLDGCEANVLMRALDRVPERMQAVRGWTDAEWADARERLRRKGFLDPAGAATDDGRAFRDGIEDATDATVSRVEVPPALTAQLQHAARLIATTGAIPYPNPVGVPRS